TTNYTGSICGRTVLHACASQGVREICPSCPHLIVGNCTTRIVISVAVAGCRNRTKIRGRRAPSTLIDCSLGRFLRSQAKKNPPAVADGLRYLELRRRRGWHAA